MSQHTKSIRPRQQEHALRSGDADLQAETRMTIEDVSLNDTNEGNQLKKICPFFVVPLELKGQTHTHSLGSMRILENEVTFDDLKRMTDLFYQKAFMDSTLDLFFHSYSDPHASRFAKWIYQKMSGSSVWDTDRQLRDKTPVRLASGDDIIVHDRSSAHVAAWWSFKRPKEDAGRHFALDECRVWMRLHFWAMRESGLEKQSPTFADYYVRFIGHFVRVYESQAPMFARESQRWSEDPRNIEMYVDNGRRMVDVMGLSLDEAKQQLREDESSDTIWPYDRQIR